MNVSSRHEGTLGDRLRPFDQSLQINVDVVVQPDLAGERSMQHCAWMLVNILSRLKGIVRKVGFVCPEHVQLQERVVPEVSSSCFAAAVLEAAKSLDVVPVHRGRTGGLCIVVGTNPEEGGWAVFGSGWTGGVSKSAIQPPVTPSTLPFGPYIAACVAAGEVFKFARLPENTYEAPHSAFFSAWTLRVSDTPNYAGPSQIAVELDALIAGVGAVGSTAVNCLWACDGVSGRVVLADNDDKGVDDTNLNRYPLFRTESLGKPKAAEAARIAGTASVQWVPLQSPAEEVDFQWSTKRVLSAVDGNRARSAIQDKYPARVIGASTSNLRAEVVRCGPPGNGPCLRCFNPPGRLKSDDDIREQLANSREEVIRSIAAAADVATDDAADWIASGKCGTAGARLLSHLRHTEAEPQEFAVGFVSVFAGTVGVAELLKDSMGSDAPLSDSEQRAVFQFWTPLASSNRSKGAMVDPNCPKCASLERIRIAHTRFSALEPKREGGGRETRSLVHCESAEKPANS